MKYRKKVGSVLIALCLTTAQPVYAGDVCKTLEKFAGVVMEKRQNGALMSGLIRVADEQNDESSKDVMKKIILKAYERSMYSTDVYKQKAITTFKNKIYMECYRARNK